MRKTTLLLLHLFSLVLPLEAQEPFAAEQRSVELVAVAVDHNQVGDLYFQPTPGEDLVELSLQGNVTSLPHVYRGPSTICFFREPMTAERVLESAPAICREIPPGTERVLLVFSPSQHAPTSIALEAVPLPMGEVGGTLILLNYTSQPLYGNLEERGLSLPAGKGPPINLEPSPSGLWHIRLLARRGQRLIPVLDNRWRLYPDQINVVLLLPADNPRRIEALRLHLPAPKLKPNEPTSDN